MITTERLYMEKFTLPEIDTLMEIEYDERNINFICTNTKAEHERELEDPDMLSIAVKRKEDDYMVGYVLCLFDLESEWVKIKRIAFREKGKGYGRETMEALLKYAFKDRKLNKAWLEAYGDNTVARKLYESLGFNTDGVLRQHMRRERGLLDMAQYSMLKGEYEELKEGDENDNH